MIPKFTRLGALLIDLGHGWNTAFHNFGIVGVKTAHDMTWRTSSNMWSQLQFRDLDENLSDSACTLQETTLLVNTREIDPKCQC